MHAVMSRRRLIQDGSMVAVAMLAGPLASLGASAGGAAGAQGTDPVWIVAADSPRAWAIVRALRVRRERIIPLSGDPVRFWREERQRLSGPVAGVTQWSDFLLLRELAYEQRRRVRSASHHPLVGGALLVRFLAY
jgi:hypothetical protein